MVSEQQSTYSYGACEPAQLQNQRRANEQPSREQEGLGGFVPAAETPEAEPTRSLLCRLHPGVEEVLLRNPSQVLGQNPTKPWQPFSSQEGIGSNVCQRLRVAAVDDHRGRIPFLPHDPDRDANLEGEEVWNQPTVIDLLYVGILFLTLSLP